MTQPDTQENRQQPVDETTDDQTSAARAAELDELFREAARDGTLAE